jgi:Amt family ammonium transporter
MQEDGNTTTELEHAEGRQSLHGFAGAAGLEEASGELPPSGLEACFEALPAMAMLVREGWVVGRNALCRRLTGFGAAEDRDDAGLRPFDELGRALIGAYELRAGGSRSRFDCLLVRRHGPPMQVSVVARQAHAAGGVCHLLLLVERVEGLAGASGSDGTFTEDVLDALPDASVITHEGRILHVNREFSRLFGHSLAECLGEDLDALVMPEGRLHENEMITHALRLEGRATIETSRRTRSGGEIEVLMVVVPVRLGGEAYGMIATYRDIRKQNDEAQRLRHNALHDALTGLANRGLFLNRLELTLARLKRRPDRAFAVIYLDLDGFKGVNDTLGHQAGDVLLLEMAQRLQQCVRPQDTVARLGGDEFALLLDECGQEDELRQIAARLEAATREPFTIDGCRATVSASMGVVIAADAELEAEAILAGADAAMYRAKAGGKACAVFGRAREGPVRAEAGGC